MADRVLHRLPLFPVWCINIYLFIYLYSINHRPILLAWQKWIRVKGVSIAHRCGQIPQHPVRTQIPFCHLIAAAMYLNIHIIYSHMYISAAIVENRHRHSLSSDDAAKRIVDKSHKFQSMIKMWLASDYLRATTISPSFEPVFCAQHVSLEFLRNVRGFAEQKKIDINSILRVNASAYAVPVAWNDSISIWILLDFILYLIFYAISCDTSNTRSNDTHSIIYMNIGRETSINSSLTDLIFKISGSIRQNFNWN